MELCIHICYVSELTDDSEQRSNGTHNSRLWRGGTLAFLLNCHFTCSHSPKRTLCERASVFFVLFFIYSFFLYISIRKTYTRDVTISISFGRNKKNAFDWKELHNLTHGNTNVNHQPSHDKFKHDILLSQSSFSLMNFFPLNSLHRTGFFSLCDAQP